VWGSRPPDPFGELPDVSRLMICIVDVHKWMPFKSTAGLPICQFTLPCAMMLMLMMLHKMAC